MMRTIVEKTGAIHGLVLCLGALTGTGSIAMAQIAIEAERIYPMAGDLKPVENGVVLCSPEGKIERVGRADEITIPGEYQRVSANVVTPGFVDAHATVGLSGILNSERHDQGAAGEVGADSARASGAGCLQWPRSAGEVAS